MFFLIPDITVQIFKRKHHLKYLIEIQSLIDQSLYRGLARSLVGYSLLTQLNFSYN